jgi:hypothetical protein
MIKRILKFMDRRGASAEKTAARLGDGADAADGTVPPEWQPLLDEMERSRGHFFITGQAGTGKSTLMGLFRRLTGKNVVVVAPTGLAAITVRGVTIHSLARLPSAVITAENIGEAADKGLIGAVDTIVIDEANQVRCDMLDGLDRFMRRNGRDASQPFGGAQIILVGDPYQLPPATRDGEQQALERAGYPGPFYFWNANVYPRLNPHRRELKTVFHQEDEGFLDVLGCIRANDIGNAKLDLLQRCVADPEFDPCTSPLHTRITANNDAAAYYNNRELYRLSGLQREYRAKRSGSALNINNPEYNFPCDETLVLRVGARVVCCRDMDPALPNGTLGIVVELEEDAVWVRTDDGRRVRLIPSLWELKKYFFNRETGRIEQSVAGTIQQIPLRHAWALTIHKSQGLTFDQVYIDLTDEAFPPGQAYIALSRCRTLAGTRLKTKFFDLDPRDVRVGDEVVEFMSSSS